MKKRRIAIICCAFLMLFLVKQESLAAEYLVYQDFKYELVEENSAVRIKEYTGNATSVTVPAEIDGKPVWYIGEAFYKNETVEKVELPEGLKVVSGFQGCIELRDIHVPSTVVKVDNFAFANCESLKTIQLPNGLVEIGDFAFYQCTDLRQIVIPDSVKVIEQAAFLECERLQKVTLSKGLTELDWETFKGCKSLKSITIPNGMKRIGDEAFYGCRALKTVSFPNSLLRIEDTAFYDCKLTQVTIPKNVTHIGKNAFYGCRKLKKVKVKSTKIKYLGFGSFGFIHDKAVVDVPNKCLKKYKKMLQRNDFNAKLK
mgnify:CR=1 FL=1